MCVTDDKGKQLSTVYPPFSLLNMHMLGDAHSAIRPGAERHYTSHKKKNNFHGNWLMLGGDGALGFWRD
jgi:hypothetical protein